jgi:hypothetical protein
MRLPANRGVHGVSGAASVVHPVIVHATAELTIDWFPKVGAVVATFPAKPSPRTRAPKGSFRVTRPPFMGLFRVTRPPFMGLFSEPAPGRSPAMVQAYSKSAPATLRIVTLQPASRTGRRP